MARPDPVPDLISRAEIVLRAGHKIFLVGKLGPPLQPSLNLFHPRPRAHSAGKWNLTSRSGSRSSLIGSNITHFTDAICQLKRETEYQSVRKFGPVRGFRLAGALDRHRKNLHSLINALD